MPVKRLTLSQQETIIDFLSFHYQNEWEVDDAVEEINHFFAKIYGYRAKRDRRASRSTRYYKTKRTKRQPSAWNKFVKTNSKKKEFQYRDGKINLKKLGVAYRRKKK